jgi:MFS family permease
MRRFDHHFTQRPRGPAGQSASEAEQPPLAPVPSSVPSGRVRERTAEAAPSWRTAVILATAAFGGLLFGYQTAIMSGLLGTPYFVQLYTHIEYNYTARLPADLETTEFGLPATTKALMTATLAAGVMVGALLSGDFADLRGRKDPIIWGCLLLCGGNAMQMAAEHGQWLFIIGRLVSGLGIGSISAVLILYISEIAPREWRGFSIAGYQLSISVGICLANAVVTKTEMMFTRLAYYIPIGVLFSFATFLGMGIYCVREYLLSP